MRDRHLVDRIGHLVADWLERLQIRGYGIGVARCQDLIKACRHDFRERHSARTYSSAERIFDLRARPLADAGFLVLRDIGSRHLERWLIELKKAGKGLFLDIAGWPLRRVAIAAGHDGIDQIAASLDCAFSVRARSE